MTPLERRGSPGALFHESVEKRLETGPLVDPFGRPVLDVRLSVNASCNLRCWFCHQEGTPGPGRMMSADEIRILARTAAGLGVKYAKITGGEPLLRADIVNIVRHLTPLFREVSLVTNGQKLELYAASLRAAGLARINVSLHSLDADVYRSLTGAHVEPVLGGVRAAREAGLNPVKVNIVATRQTLERLDALLDWGARERVTLQLIELHAPTPPPPGDASRRQRGTRLTRSRGTRIAPSRHGGDPARPPWTPSVPFRRRASCRGDATAGQSLILCGLYSASPHPRRFP